MSKQSKKLDLNQLAKRIVDVATGQTEPEEEIDEKKKAAADEKRLKAKKDNAANTD